MKIALLFILVLLKTWKDQRIVRNASNSANEIKLISNYSLYQAMSAIFC